MKKTNHLAITKMIADITNGEPVAIKMHKERKPRAKETKPRNMAEKKLEKDIIFYLNLSGLMACKAGEESIYNKKHVLPGMSDLLVFVPYYGVIFMEVKTPKGLQSTVQRDFEEYCKKCNLFYCLVRSVSEAMEMVNIFKKKVEKKVDKV